MRIRGGKIHHIDLVDACYDCEDNETCGYLNEKVSASEGVKIMVMQFCETANYGKVREALDGA